MPRNVQKAKDLKGLFIHQDSKHGTVFFDIFTGNGYVLSSSEVKKYTLSISFLPIAVIIYFFLSQFNVSSTTAILIAVIFYAAAQIIYRITFVYKLPCIGKYDLKKRGTLTDNLAKSYSKQRLLALAIMLALIIALTMYYLSINDFTGSILIGLYVLIAFSYIFFFIAIVSYIKNKKSQK